MRTITRRAAVAAILLGIVAGQPAAQPAAAAGNRVQVRPGELVIDPPTLINLGFEWIVDGDDNRNAAVDVSYR
jgi:hypothetical protein